MLAEYALRIISGVVVGIYIARYLGPEQFGLISYVTAVVSVFMALSRLGMDSILVRDLGRSPEKRQEIMSTAFALMLLASVVCLTVLCALILILESEFQVKVYTLVVSSGILFQSFMVIDYNFQAQVQAKYSSIAKSAALIFSAVSKFLLVVIDADLVAFAFFYALDHMVVALFLISLHFYRKQISFLFGFDKSLVMPLLQSAWPMVLSAMAVVLYMRVDQVMIKNMLSSQDLGIYVAAVKIYEGWLALPYIISVSLLPAIVKLRARSADVYVKRLTMVFSLLFWLSAASALLVSFFGEKVIYYIYGSEYAAGNNVLAIVMWATTFAAIGSVTARYLTVENMEKKIAFRTIAGLIINVVLNLIMIPAYGIEGAAAATLITLFVVNYALNYFDKDLKQLVSICNSAITMRWLWK